jgi:2-polyprenyl-3-methyl-5-hydroxy-6-metoxy-1,4-benzoquinol methylase
VAASVSADETLWSDMPALSVPAATALSCPSCGGEEFRTLPLGTPDVSALAFDVLECVTCALCHLRHRLTASQLDDYTRAFYGMIADSIAAKSMEKARRFFDERAASFGHLKPGRLLDVGCQHGLFLEAMQKRGWNVAGVEPIEHFARMARTRLGVPVSTARVEELSAAGTYDLVTLWHVFEHFEDPVTALTHCVQLLGPGGRIFVEVPNIDSFGALLGRSFWPGFRDPTHRWFFRPESLQRLAAKVGLKVVSVGSAGTPAAWYTLKRGIGGRILKEDHWWRKMQARPRSNQPLWRRAFRSTVTFYPFMRALAWLGRVSGHGEVLHAWLERI